ncbi:MAG: conjugal transfer protein TraX [Defluviitaleaceae bacterium]|nr:conjugal transfer protein TraX [Defluviitaleaceae bacterium]
MSVFVLKIIAVVSMLIDHFGAVVYIHLVDGPGRLEIYHMMRNVGRIAFPVFAYLVAQGCLHTKNINKYLLRLGFLALVSEVFFDLAFMYGRSGISFVRDTNIFYTLFLGVAAVAVYERLCRGEKPTAAMKIGLAAAAVLPMMFVAYYLSSDYSIYGVAMIFLIYVAGPFDRAARCGVMLAVLFFLYYPFGAQYQFINPRFLFAAAAAVLVHMYNGRPGPSNAVVKWGFYFFYPVHIAVLVAVREFIL